MRMGPNEEQADVRGLVEGSTSFGTASGVEQELPLEQGDLLIAEPFDPDAIEVSTRSMTIDLLLSRIRDHAIDLEPDFQRRRGIWTERQQSRLIESLLLRIPLPTLYAAEDEKEGWAIVDGIQRLTTITRFMDPEAINETPLRLTGLEYLGTAFNNLLLMTFRHGFSGGFVKRNLWSILLDTAHLKKLSSTYLPVLTQGGFHFQRKNCATL